MFVLCAYWLPLNLRISGHEPSAKLLVQTEMTCASPQVSAGFSVSALRKRAEATQLTQWGFKNKRTPGSDKLSNRAVAFSWLLRYVVLSDALRSKDFQHDFFGITIPSLTMKDGIRFGRICSSPSAAENFCNVASWCHATGDVSTSFHWSLRCFRNTSEKLRSSAS